MSVELKIYPAFDGQGAYGKIALFNGKTSEEFRSKAKGRFLLSQAFIAQRMTHEDYVRLTKKLEVSSLPELDEEETRILH